MRNELLQFYHVVSAIPKHLATKAKSPVPPESEPYTENNPLFSLDDLKTIHLGQANARDFYYLYNKKKKSHKVSNWPNKVESNYAAGWRGLEKLIFTSMQSTCKETKLKEFQFNLLHRIVTKKKLLRYGIKTDDKCLYWGEHYLIDE